jgi:hypothetical protein
MRRRSVSPVTLFSTTVLVLLLISAAIAVLFDLPENVKNTVIGLWVVVPPLWFWMEFCFFFEKGLTPFSNDFEKFKYGQEVSKNLWLAISAILVLIYFGKLPGF